MRFALLAAATLLALACRDGGAPQANVVRSDSAGVRLITSTGPDTALAWRFDTVGVLTDSLGEPWLFTGISPQMVLTDRAGRTYVLDREPAVRRFGRTGQYERSFGRRGGGPGEMEFPIQLLQQGDSIAALDLGRDAVVRWGPDLEPIGDLPLRGGLERTQMLAFRQGGLWREQFAFDSVTTTATLHGDTLPGSELATLRQPPRTTAAPLEGCGGRLRLNPPVYFAPTLRWNARGARLLVSTGPQYELSLYEGNRLLARVRRDLTPRAPTVDDLQRMYPEGMKVIAGGLTCTIPVADILLKAQLAEWMPFVFNLVLLPDATMWVQRSLPNETPVVLDVFASDGAYAGTVRGMHLPVGLLPNGELLVPQDDEESGGLVIRRLVVRK